MENHGKPWKMKKIKSRPGNVMENENLAKNHGKVMEFELSQMSLPFLLRKMC